MHLLCFIFVDIAYFFFVGQTLSDVFNFGNKLLYYNKGNRDINQYIRSCNLKHRFCCSVVVVFLLLPKGEVVACCVTLIFP